MAEFGSHQETRHTAKMYNPRAKITISLLNLQLYESTEEDSAALGHSQANRFITAEQGQFCKNLFTVRIQYSSFHGKTKFFKATIEDHNHQPNFDNTDSSKLQKKPKNKPKPKTQGSENRSVAVVLSVQSFSLLWRRGWQELFQASLGFFLLVFFTTGLSSEILTLFPKLSLHFLIYGWIPLFFSPGCGEGQSNRK